MRILFSTNKMIGSKIIKWGTDGDCSHFAWSFDEQVVGNGLVFHSTGQSKKGPSTMLMRDFLAGNKVVHAITTVQPLSLLQEEAVYQDMLNGCNGIKGYDYPAIGWWTWRLLLWKLFKIPVTSANMWDQKKLAICTELAPIGLQALNKHITGIKIPVVDYSMCSPSALRVILQGVEGLRPDAEWVAAANAL